MEEKNELDEWLSDKPDSIKKLVSEYPPGEYMMKDGAPYGISCAGTKVGIQSYNEDGTVGVVVLAENKTEAGLEHERMLGLKYNKTPEEMEEIHKQNVRVVIDPNWMKLITTNKN